MTETICFRVVEEPYGWAARIGNACMTPFGARKLAVRHANGMALRLRARGQRADIVNEEPRGQDVQETLRPLGEHACP